MSRALFWFKNDLRLDDNPGLTKACAYDELLGVYCIDARFDADSAFGPMRVGAHRKAFIRQALDDLNKRMSQRGSRLLVCAGEPEEVLPALAERWRMDAVYTRSEIAPEEQGQIARVRRALRPGCALETVHGGTLYRDAQLPFDLAQLPGVYTKFRKAVEQQLVVEPPLDAARRLPRWSEPVADDDNATDLWTSTACPYVGGETAGAARLEHYLWDTQALAHYKETRNQLLGLDFSSKLSPWLAAGCISPRRVAADVARFEADVVANKSTYWLLFELLWREFYYWTLSANGSALFQRDGLLGREDRPDALDQDVLNAWQRGETGMPFIDANMRELAATGYMSNRGRQNAASYLARDLGQDWRAGAAWFECQLVDYDVASNWGNWATVAGVGTDKRDNGFNIMAQALRYDPDAAYISAWLPELGALPVEHRHAPFMLDSNDLSGIRYPRLKDWPQSWRLSG